MGASTLAQARQTDAKSKSLADPRFRVVRVAFWFVAGTIGFLQIWLQDRTIWADTLSYLDSGDMLWQGDLKNAITCHWSPGYPFLLGFALKVFHPVGLWEVAVVKLVDLILFLFTLACFDFFVNQFCLYHETSASSEQRGLKLVVPKIALASVAYLLFIWTITRLLIAWFSTPDMLVMGIMFLIFGLLLKVKLGNTGFPIFVALGLVLGFGYWIKAPLFPLAFMFLAIAFLLVGDRRRATPRVLVSFALFALIAMPLVIKLSASAGKLTFGE